MKGYRTIAIGLCIAVVTITALLTGHDSYLAIIAIGALCGLLGTTIKPLWTKVYIQPKKPRS